MSNTGITDSAIRKLNAANQPYFLRDATLRGFGVKVNPSGTKKFIAEVRDDGHTYTGTLAIHLMLHTGLRKNEALGSNGWTLEKLRVSLA